jgi:hypothetical protein
MGYLPFGDDTKRHCDLALKISDALTGMADNLPQLL